MINEVALQLQHQSSWDYFPQLRHDLDMLGLRTCRNYFAAKSGNNSFLSEILRFFIDDHEYFGGSGVLISGAVDFRNQMDSCQP